MNNKEIKNDLGLIYRNNGKLEFSINNKFNLEELKKFLNEETYNDIMKKMFEMS